MPSDSGADRWTGTPRDIADHVVATSEREPPEETVARLFGDHDPQEAVAARETIAALFGQYDSEGEAAETPGDTGRACGVESVPGPGEDGSPVRRIDDTIEADDCADGALIVAELADEPVTVRMYDPETGAPVTFEIADDGRKVRPEDAVVSMGMAETVPDSEDVITFGVDVATGEADPRQYVDHPRDVFCRNFLAFEGPETYQRWAEDADAVSVAVPAAEFAEMIHRLTSDPAFW